MSISATVDTVQLMRDDAAKGLATALTEGDATGHTWYLSRKLAFDQVLAVLENEGVTDALRQVAGR